MCRNYGCNRIKPSPFLTIESVSREQTLMDATAGFGRIKRSIIGEVEESLASCWRLQCFSLKYAH